MHTSSVIKTILLLICFFVGFKTFSQGDLLLKKGVIMDSIPIPNTQQVFNLYLPKTFDNTTTYPLILGFDTKNKAATITRLYQATAENLGYIVASINVPETLTGKQKNAQTLDFINYVFSILPIQKGRVYVTGVNQGAIYASLLPVLYSKDIFGIIAIGNTQYYSVHKSLKKNTSHIGITNTYNFRLIDFLDNKKYLNRKGIPADVYSYNTKSEVPDQSMLHKALITFSLQAMSKGRMPKDSIFIKKQYESDLKSVEDYIDKKDFIEALEEVKRIQNLYSVFFDTDDLKEKLREIKAIKEYKRQKRLWSKYNYRERLLRATYLNSLEEDIDFIAYDNMGWWNYQMSELDTLINGEEMIAARMAHRLKGYLKEAVKVFQVSIAKSKSKEKLEQELFLHILNTIIDSENYDAYVKIISLTAKDQDNETALFYLEQLLKNGYTDFESLYTIEGTLALKLSREYNVLVKKYLGKAKYYFPN